MSRVRGFNIFFAYLGEGDTLDDLLTHFPPPGDGPYIAGIWFATDDPDSGRFGSELRQMWQKMPHSRLGFESTLESGVMYEVMFEVT